MKKLLALFLVVGTLVLLVACNGGTGGDLKESDYTQPTSTQDDESKQEGESKQESNTEIESEDMQESETEKADGNGEGNDQPPKIQTQGYVLAVSTSTHSNSNYDLPNGMSMFYLLSDGTFLVFDGGQGIAASSIDAHHLYKQLRAVADENGIEQIVVSAWVITHAHRDHYGFGQVFFSTYQNEVQINSFLYNAVAGNSASQTVKKMLSSNYPTAKIFSLDVGTCIWLADVQVEVLMTPEALTADKPNAINEDFNNSSLVLKLTVGNKTVLMTGDASKAAWEWLAETYPAVDGVSKLKSDVLQVPHHGAKTAGTTAGYALVDPDVLVYPAGARLYERCVNPKYSNYQESTAVLISNTAKKHGDTTLDPTDLNALIEKEYFFLAGEYLGTEQELTSTRQCFLKASES